MKLFIPETQQIKGLYTYGNEYRIGTVEYVGQYCIDKTTGKQYTGFRYDPSTSKELLPFLPNNKSTKTSHIPKKKINPSEKDVASGFFYRYFYLDGVITETHQQTYKQLKTKQKCSIRWQITGPMEDWEATHGTTKVLMPGILTANSTTAKLADQLVPGLYQYLKMKGFDDYTTISKNQG